MQDSSTRVGGPEVDEDTVQCMEELNDLDMQRSDSAKALFQQRYQLPERREQHPRSQEECPLHGVREALPWEGPEEPGRGPPEDMSHIIETWQWRPLRGRGGETR